MIVELSVRYTPSIAVLHSAPFARITHEHRHDTGSRTARFPIIDMETLRATTEPHG